MTSFPSSVKTFSTIVDLVDSVLAAHQNERGDEITALQNYLIETATEKTVSGGVLTVDKSRHKVQPQSGTTDDIDTITGIPDGATFYIYASDAGTDTLTLKHGTGNLSCVGASDVAISRGFAICYRSGSTVYVAGGGGGGGAYGALFPEDSTMLNGKISVTVASNNITVALKTLAGTDPSTSDPVYVRIGDTVRSVTAALSVTKNAGTQWFGLGTPFATLEQQFFVYLIWNTTPATDVVDIGFARVPYFRVYSEASGTTTNEKYLAYGNASAPTSTDDMVNVGRFSATLSAAASYNWSVPTFTTANLIQRPIFETDFMDWLPAPTGYSSVPTNVIYKYKIYGKNIEAFVREATNGTSNATTLTMTAPFTALTLTNGAWQGYGSGADNGAGLTTMVIGSIVSAGTTFSFSKDPAGGAWTNANGKRVGAWRIWYQIA